MKEHWNEIVIGTIIVLLIVARYFPSKSDIEQYRKNRSNYNEAVEHMQNGEWEEAVGHLSSCSRYDYKDSKDLQYYCEAHIEFQQGEIYSAQFSLNRIRSGGKWKKGIEELREQVEAALPDFWRRVEEQGEKRRKDEEAAARKGKPYAGMPEKWIDITSWGAHGRLRHNTIMEHGQPYTQNLYDFYQNGHLRYTVRCLRGVVVDVYDWGDSFGALTRGPGSAGNGNNIPNSASTTKSDPYNARDYAHPDDFYYDHYDDFYDFEDAEAYYYAHCN